MKHLLGKDLSATIRNSSMGFPAGSDSKESACNAGDLGSNHGLGRFPGEGNGKPLQYSCLENSTDRGVWWATVHGVTKSWTRLRDFHFQDKFYLKPHFLMALNSNI